MSRFSVQLADGTVYGPATREMLLDWAREGRIPKDAMLVGDGDPVPVADDPEVARIVLAPPTRSTGVRSTAPSSASGMIPTGNPPALIGYYLGVGSLIPFLGLVFAPFAIVLGIIGFLRVRKHPAARGTAHAILAITLPFVGIGVVILIVVVGQLLG